MASGGQFQYTSCSAKTRWMTLRSSVTIFAPHLLECNPFRVARRCSSHFSSNTDTPFGNPSFTLPEKFNTAF